MRSSSVIYTAIIASIASLGIVGCGSEDNTTATSSRGSGGEGGGGGEAGTSSSSSSNSSSSSSSSSSGMGGAGGGSNTVCGDSKIDANEDCDLGNENGAASSCCSADCKLTTGNTCRKGSGDDCDPDEVCDGANVACPDDVIADSTVKCRQGSGDVCDPDEVCPGIAGQACPADVIADSTVKCRQGSGDVCDPDEVCSGIAGQACPMDVFADSTVRCRPGSGDVCDPDEVCSGIAGQACPMDVFADSTVRCRQGSGDICDPDELCSGMAGQACPADVINGGTVCFTACSNKVSVMCSGIAGDACDACPTLLPINGKSVVIVESQSFNGAHDMDVEWRNLATSLGLSATISPQTVLDNENFFATTDILIVSSGVIALPVNRVTTVLHFLQAGKGVYLQGEYDINYQSNLAFKSIIEQTGGSFTWTNSVNGSLEPITPQGCLAATNICTSPLTYFFYAATGTWNAAGLTPFLFSNASPIGWTYDPPGLGRMVFNTDQDWVRARDMNPTHIDLMQNILMRLGNP